MSDENSKVIHLHVPNQVDVPKQGMEPKQEPDQCPQSTINQSHEVSAIGVSFSQSDPLSDGSALGLSKSDGPSYTHSLSMKTHADQPNRPTIEIKKVVTLPDEGNATPHGPVLLRSSKPRSHSVPCGKRSSSPFNSESFRNLKEPWRSKARDWEKKATELPFVRTMTRSKCRELPEVLEKEAEEHSQEVKKRDLIAHNVCTQNGVLHPSSTIHVVLDFILWLLSAYFLILTPMQLAGVIREESVQFFVINLLLDSVYLADVLLNFVTAYMPQSDELAHLDGMELFWLVVNRKQIARRFLTDCKGGFIPQLIRSFPLEIIFGASMLQTHRTLGYPELEQLRLWRGLRFIGRLTFFWSVSKRNRIQGFLIRELHVMAANFSVRYLLTYVSYSCLIIHWCVCLHAWVSSCNAEEPECHLNEFVFIREEPLAMDRQYLLSVVQVLRSYNGDIDVTSDFTMERLVVATVLCVVGVVIFGAIFGEFISIIKSHRAEEKAHQQNMRVVQRDVRSMLLPQMLQDRITNYMHLYGGRIGRENAARQSWVKKLNEGLRGVLELHLQSGLVAEFSIMCKLLHQSRAVAIKICCALQPHLLLYGDIVGYRHTCANHLSFLHTGCFRRALEVDSDQPPDENIQEGDFGCFGDEAAFPTKARTVLRCTPNIESPEVCFPSVLLQEDLLFAFTITAVETSEVYDISRAAFSLVKAEFKHSEHLDAIKAFEDGLEELDDIDVGSIAELESKSRNTCGSEGHKASVVTLDPQEAAENQEFLQTARKRVSARASFQNLSPCSVQMVMLPLSNSQFRGTFSNGGSLSPLDSLPGSNRGSKRSYSDTRHKLADALKGIRPTRSRIRKTSSLPDSPCIKTLSNESQKSRDSQKKRESEMPTGIDAE